MYLFARFWNMLYHPCVAHSRQFWMVVQAVSYMSWDAELLASHKHCEAFVWPYPLCRTAYRGSAH